MIFETRGDILTAPEQLDWTKPEAEIKRRREVWAVVLTEAVSYHDPWAFLVTAPDGDIRIFDVSAGSIWEATGYGPEALMIHAERGWDSPKTLTHAATA